MIIALFAECKITHEEKTIGKMEPNYTMQLLYLIIEYWTSFGYKNDQSSSQHAMIKIYVL